MLCPIPNRFSQTKKKKKRKWYIKNLEALLFKLNVYSNSINNNSNPPANQRIIDRFSWIGNKNKNKYMHLFFV